MQHLYFAHPLNVYGTELERDLMGTIKRYFGKHIKIINPSDPVHQEMVISIKSAHNENPEEGSKKVMAYFLSITSSCDGGIGLPFSDDKFGAGVYAELERISKNGHPTWKITPSGVITLAYELATLECLTVEETRARVYYPDKTIRPYE